MIMMDNALSSCSTAALQRGDQGYRTPWLALLEREGFFAAEHVRFIEMWAGNVAAHEYIALEITLHAKKRQILQMTELPGSGKIKMPSFKRLRYVAERAKQKGLAPAMEQLKRRISVYKAMVRAKRVSLTRNSMQGMCKCEGISLASATDNQSRSSGCSSSTSSNTSDSHCDAGTHIAMDSSHHDVSSNACTVFGSNTGFTCLAYRMWLTLIDMLRFD